MKRNSINVAELVREIDSGKTVTEVARAHNISPESLNQLRVKAGHSYDGRNGSSFEKRIEFWLVKFHISFQRGVNLGPKAGWFRDHKVDFVIAPSTIISVKSQTTYGTAEEKIAAEFLSLQALNEQHPEFKIYFVYHGDAWKANWSWWQNRFPNICILSYNDFLEHLMSRRIA